MHCSNMQNNITGVICLKGAVGIFYQQISGASTVDLVLVFSDGWVNKVALVCVLQYP